MATNATSARDPLGLHGRREPDDAVPGSADNRPGDIDCSPQTRRAQGHQSGRVSGWLPATRLGPFAE
jgi:hypothetical protein